MKRFCLLSRHSELVPSVGQCRNATGSQYVINDSALSDVPAIFLRSETRMRYEPPVFGESAKTSSTAGVRPSGSFDAPPWPDGKTLMGRRFAHFATAFGLIPERLSLHFGQTANRIAPKTAVERRTRQIRDSPPKGIEAVIQRRQAVITKDDNDSRRNRNSGATPSATFTLTSRRRGPFLVKHNKCQLRKKC